MNVPSQRIRVLSSGIFSLILLLGVARFSYTPMLPLMQQQADLSISGGGWLASINYMGYLCGALIASFISNMVIKDRLYRIGLILAVISTAGMGLTESFWLWAIFRFLAGLCAAAGLILASGLIMNWLIRHGHKSELGIHFSGMGLGIVLTTVIIELMSVHFNWREQWFWLSIFGFIFLIPAWSWMPRPDVASITQTGHKLVDSPPGKTFIRTLMVAYFCAGVGYVISATFIVAIVESIPELTGKGNWTFIVLGLAATPACIFWDLVARRVGDFNALISASLLQAIGILLPVIEPNFILIFIGAFLFGGTFIGIVSLVLSMAGRYYPTRPAKMMGKVTISFGIAQIIAPAITGVLAHNAGNYNTGLYLAAFIMLLGSFLFWVLKILDKK